MAPCARTWRNNSRPCCRKNAPGAASATDTASLCSAHVPRASCCCARWHRVKSNPARRQRFMKAQHAGPLQARTIPCAELYLLARRTAPDAPSAKNYFLSAVAAMQSSGKAAAALELAERELGDLHDDPDTLAVMVQLARAAGRPDIAERYVKQLLRLALLQQWQPQMLAQATPSGVVPPATHCSTANPARSATTLRRPGLSAGPRTAARPFRPVCRGPRAAHSRHPEKDGRNPSRPRPAVRRQDLPLGTAYFLENRNLWRMPGG